jgi:predicted dehydrogenase
MRKLRLVQVGLGTWGTNWATEILPTVETVELVGYVDIAAPARERLKAKLGVPGAMVFTSLREALAAVECDAVLVTLLTAFHVEACTEALEAGKHVIVEKPFTPTLPEAARLVELAEAQGRLLMVSQNYRFYPAPIAAAALVAGGTLGRVQSVALDFRRDAGVDGHNYPTIPAPLLADMAIHHFDLLRFVLADEAVEIACRSWNPAGSPFTNDCAATFWARFRSGTVVSYRGSFLSRGPQTAWGGEWAMELAGAAVAWTSRGSAGVRLAADRVAIRMAGGEPLEQALPPLRHYDRAGTTAAFAAAIASGTTPPGFSSGRDNVRSLALVEAAIRSAESGGAPVALADILPAGWEA